MALVPRTFRDERSYSVSHDYGREAALDCIGFRRGDPFSGAIECARIKPQRRGKVPSAALKIDLRPLDMGIEVAEWTRDPRSVLRFDLDLVEEAKRL